MNCFKILQGLLLQLILIYYILVKLVWILTNRILIINITKWK